MVPVVSLQRGSVVRASVSFRLCRNLQPAVPAAPPPASPRAATSLAAAVGTVMRGARVEPGRSQGGDGALSGSECC